MIEAHQFWTPKNEWQAKFKAFEVAAGDLESDEVKTDEMITFYAQAQTRALTDFLLLPVDSPKALLLKMALVKMHEVFSWQQSEFDTIWSALIEDTKRIGGWTEPKELS